VGDSAKTVTLQYHAMWKVDVNTGLVSYPTTKKRYAVGDAQMLQRSGGGSSSASRNKSRSLQPSVYGIRHLTQPVRTGDEIAFHNMTGTGARQWLSLHFTVNDPQGLSYLDQLPNSDS
jgi:hypothetical protein